MPSVKHSKPKVKKTSAPKVVKSAVIDPVPDPVPAPVVETPVVDTPIVSEGNNVQVPQLLNYDDDFKSLQTQLKDAMALVKTAMVGLSALERKVARDKKVVDKKMKTKVKRVKDPNAPPSGFQKPLKVSPELQKFLGLPDGELIARTQVTKSVNAYCKEHDLQKPDDKRVILADKTLKTLLKLGKNDQLTFFNLQKYLKPHYPNKEGVFVN
jgi:chromatin remodeling complex protein RSC6